MIGYFNGYQLYFVNLGKIIFMELIKLILFYIGFISNE